MTLLRAFSTLGCPERSLEETLALARRHGIGAVELRALGGTADIPAHLREVYGSPGKLADRLRGEPVRIVSLDTSFALAGHTPADRESFLAFIPWAEGLGVPWLRVFDGRASGPGTAAGEAAESVRWWRELRARNGWRSDLIVETHDALTNTRSILAFAKLAPEAGILWDTHHTWRMGEDPVATWRAIRSSVVHIHVKDSVSRPGGKPPYTYVLPGEGEFPIAPLLAALEADRFFGAVSLEWERMWHRELPPLEEALSAAARKRWW